MIDSYKYEFIVHLTYFAVYRSILFKLSLSIKNRDAIMHVGLKGLNGNENITECKPLDCF